MSLLSRQKNKVILSYRGKALLQRLLYTPVVGRSLLYKFIYHRYIDIVKRSMGSSPLHVWIENTNICNNSCCFCVRDELKRPKGVMDGELYRNIILQCAKYRIKNVLIQGLGEPLTDKDYIERIKFAKLAGLTKVICNTNGILLTEDVSEGLIKAGLDCIRISLNAVTEETYKQINRDPIRGAPSENFSLVLRNIENLIKIRKSLKAKNPYIVIRLKGFESNEIAVQRFIDKYKDSVDKISIRFIVSRWPDSSNKDYFPQNAHYFNIPCFYLWGVLFINYDGIVPLCIQDFNSRFILGDTRKEGLLDIWRGKAIELIRNKHLTGKYSELELCSKCEMNNQVSTPYWGLID